MWRLPGVWVALSLPPRPLLGFQGYNMGDEYCKTLLDRGQQVSAHEQWQHGYPGKQGILEGIK